MAEGVRNESTPLAEQQDLPTCVQAADPRVPRSSQDERSSRSWQGHAATLLRGARREAEITVSSLTIEQRGAILTHAIGSGTPQETDLSPWSAKSKKSDGEAETAQETEAKNGGRREGPG